MHPNLRDPVAFAALKYDEAVARPMRLLHAGLHVREGHGVHVEASGRAFLLDPTRVKTRSRGGSSSRAQGTRIDHTASEPDVADDRGPVRVVTHAHLDHLSGDALMTPATLDFLRVRKPRARGTSLPYGETREMEGGHLTLLDAGHVLGSAMVRLDLGGERVLYTGDYCPEAGLTVGGASPEPCDVLVTESTYGDPRFVIPPRALVLANLESWMTRRLLNGSVALGAYQLGRAQELVALANRAGLVPVVSADIAQACAIYNAHGHDLTVTVLGSPREREEDGAARLYVVPRAWLRRDHAFARRLAGENGAGAYVSGWCHVYSYFEKYFIEAQFPLTDHATFPGLLEFTKACKPRIVYTMHGYSAELAHAIEAKLGITARPLGSVDATLRAL